MFQHLILGLLRDGKPRHAFLVAKEYERRSDNTGHPANFSRELRKMADEGLVTRERNAGSEDDRAIPYRITAKGCEKFDAWLVTPDTLAKEFDSWLLFCALIDAPTQDRLLEGHEDDLWHELRRMNRRGADNGNGSVRGWRTAHLATSLEFVRGLRKKTNGRSQEES